MIPKQLRLRNFLSYREATLTFDGLHVACVSGPNGAGKSSLLEAIAWALWGQSRAATEDDVIHLGTREAQVDFIFEHQQQVYRVVRSRRHHQGGTLEFQVNTAQGFRSLTQRGMRATQQIINQTLRLDYETFTQSAYLRQGRADEFMLKRPAERKQILADLLKLDQYDELAERAKERTREAKAQIAVLEASLTPLQAQVSQRSAVAQTAEALAAQLAQLDQEQTRDQQQLAAYQQQQQQRQRLQQSLALLHQQQAHLQTEGDRLQATLEQLHQQQAALADCLAEAETITSGMQTLQALTAQEETLAAQLARQQALQAERDRLQQIYQRQVHRLETDLHSQRLHLSNLDQQLADLEPLLAKRTTVEAALAELQQARQQLHRLEQLQLQVSPLQQRQQTLQHQLDQARTELTAHLTSLTQSAAQLEQQQAQYPHLQQAVLDVGQTLEALSAKRAYQEQVREKGLERRQFMERLQAEQRQCEQRLAEIDQKLHLLRQPDAACPLCDRPLTDHSWEHVIAQHRQEKEDLLQRIWGIREQLAVSEREIQVLRQEYRDLETSLSHYGRVLEQRGRLMAQLNSTQSVAAQLQTVLQRRSQLEHSLANQTYGAEIQAELQHIQQQLAALGYDERDHALVRGQIDRLRWAEIRQAEIRQAERKQQQLTQQRPEMVAAIAQLEAEWAALARCETVTQLTELERQIAALGYSWDEHQQLRAQLRCAQTWAQRYQALEQARQQAPQVQQRLAQVQEQQQQLEQQQATLAAQQQALKAQLEQCPDLPEQRATVQQRLGDRQQQREQMLSQIGALQQQLTHLDHLQVQFTQQQQALHQAQRQYRVYQELAHAFGRNGLQALLIEQILPQLEAETNYLLGRLSHHQLHVQFVTQRAGRRRQSKLIDTLDIVIADAQGTRPYETYSGGEAFRVNFAIRLALARLLAQRSGTPLQMLIIDEGFGTQDRDGCDRLIAAINAIASDFACILAVTHIPHFREAFPTRIDVCKTPDGSQLTLSV